MTRTMWLLLLLGLMVGVGATALVSNLTDDTEVLGVQVTPAPSPTPDPEPTPSPTAEPIPSPDPQPTVTPRVVTVTPEPTETTTTASRSTPAPPSRTAPPRPASIDCASDAHGHLCSREQRSMTVSDGRMEVETGSTGSRDPAFPAFTMDTTILNEDGGPAEQGDRVGLLEISVRIVNDTDKTFILPEGEVQIALTRDGEPARSPVVREGRFEMNPGAELRANFKIPISQDGSYEWQGQTWFYEA